MKNSHLESEHVRIQILNVYDPSRSINYEEKYYSRLTKERKKEEGDVWESTGSDVPCPRDSACDLAKRFGFEPVIARERFTRVAACQLAIPVYRHRGDSSK